MEEKAKLQSQLPKRRSRTSLEDARRWVFLEVPLLRGPRTGVHPQNSKVTIVNKRVSGPSCYSNVIASEDGLRLADFHQIYCPSTDASDFGEKASSRTLKTGEEGF